MFKVGLTGGIGSGKTSICKVFADCGIDIIEADDVSREVVELGSPCLKAIHEYFGDDILLDDGNLNRAVLRERIFSNAREKHWLEQLLHPAIRKRIIEKLEESTSAYCILSSPLFFETNQQVLVNRTLVVDVPEEIQLARASARDDVDQKHIRAIMDSQITRDKRLELADDIIDNSGDFELARKAALKLHSYYLELASHDS